MKVFKLFGELLLFCFIFLFSSSNGCQDNITISDVLNLVQSNPTTPRIIDIGKKLLANEAEINAFKILIKRPLNLDGYKKFVELSKDLENLRINILDQKISGKHEPYKPTISLLWNLYHSSAGTIIRIRKILEGFRGDFSINGVIKAIKKLQFKDAEDILDFNDKDSSFIPSLVSEIYANNTGNVTILLDFVKSLSAISRSLLTLKTLKKEAESIGKFDLILMIDFIEILEKDIINRDLNGNHEHNDAKNFRDSLRIFLKKNSSDTMTSKMISRTFINAPKMDIFLKKLYDLDDKLSNEIMFEVINRVYGKIRNKELLDNIFARCYIPQREDAFVYVYEKMRDTNQLYTAILTLAKYFCEIKKMNDFDENLSAKRHKDFDTILNAIPLSLKLLYSAPSICMQNSFSKEYLYADSQKFTHWDNQRYVFTWITQERSPEAEWYVETPSLKTNEIYLRNKVHNEYIYASEEHISPNTGLKYVFTKIRKAEHINNTRYAWNLEYDEGKIRFRSVSNNGLLCSTSHMFDEKRRNVSTIRDINIESSKRCSWMIEYCSKNS